MSLIKTDGTVSTDHVALNPMPITSIRTVTSDDFDNKPINAQIVSDGSNDRILQGFQEDGFGTGKDFGFKISQEGYDVKTCTDDRLVMSSSFNGFKIVESGSILFGSKDAYTNYDRYTAYVTLKNTYSSPPMIIATWQNGSYYRPIPFYFYSKSSADYHGGLDMMIYLDYVTATNIQFIIDDFQKLGTWANTAVKYYVLLETSKP